MAAHSSSTVARFWSKVQIHDDPSMCWEWKCYRDKGGYGRIKIDGQMAVASRVAWEIANNRRLGAWVARHTCDNPSCCNPRHILHGTAKDNARDKMERGRYRTGDFRGEKNPRARLSVADLQSVKSRIRAGESNVSIAASFGVTHQTISKIKTGVNWSGM